MKNKLSNMGFTLAEVLITLGIIGIVAALTIPELINNYKAERYRTKFLKTYSTLQQVFKQMQSDDVSLDPASYPYSRPFYRTFKNYITGGVVDCGRLDGQNIRTSPCYYVRAKKYKDMSGKKTFQTPY